MTCITLKTDTFHHFGSYGYFKKKSEAYIRLNCYNYVLARVGKVFERNNGITSKWAEALVDGKRVYAFGNHLVPYISFVSLINILGTLCVQKKYERNTFSVPCRELLSDGY